MSDPTAAHDPAPALASEPSSPTPIPPAAHGHAPASVAPALHVEFCDEFTEATPPGPFVIGREGDLAVDDNPYLHRAFLHLAFDHTWWVHNVGTSLSATLSDGDGAVHAWLAPGGSLPVLFGRTDVRFTAGPTNYVLSLHLDTPAMTIAGHIVSAHGATTINPVDLTLNQRLLVVSLAEPSLRSGTSTPSALPSSKEAAARLGWAMTKFNRQLDAVCQKLARSGVRGLHGATGQLATQRRARLVEYALSVRLVTTDDLALLDLPPASDASD